MTTISKFQGDFDSLPGGRGPRQTAEVAALKTAVTESAQTGEAFFIPATEEAEVVKWESRLRSIAGDRKLTMEIRKLPTGLAARASYRDEPVSEPEPVAVATTPAPRKRAGRRAAGA